MPERISRVFAREVLDSRGNPTVEATVWAGRKNASAMVPSGASVGRHEATELRDGGKRFHGKGVLKAVANVNKKIARRLKGKKPNPATVDALLLSLDGTQNKRRLGANAVLSVSTATTRLAALLEGKPLHEFVSSLAGAKPRMPCPAANLINGGAHAGNKLPIQEYMVLPVGATSFREATRLVAETYHELKRLLARKYGPQATNVGDEGGFAPPLSNPVTPLELISKVLDELGYAKKFKLGIDAAASNFFRKNKYSLNSHRVDSGQLVDFYAALAKKFPALYYVEDPFHEEDFAAFAELTKKNRFLVVGDDLLTTNVKRIKRAVEAKACNALLLKPNQVGTISEAINAVLLARESGWKVVASHRSGETEDAFLADFAVGLGTEFIKLGAPCRGERTCKYNQLLRIEEALA